MQFSSRERNILILAAAVAAIFIALNVWPMITGVYQAREERIDTIALDVRREARLVEDTTLWSQRRAETEARTADLERQLFTGETVPVVEALIQRELTQHARESGLQVSSTRLAERLENADWLLITQEMAFRTDSAANTIRFLERLDNSEPRLLVKDFSIIRNRNQFSGTIVVAAFMRRDELGAGALVQR